MMNQRMLMAILLGLGLWLSPPLAIASPASSAAKAATKRILARDAARDAATAARPLERSQNLSRYTSRQQAEREAAHGLESGRHLTGSPETGRPLSAKSAQKRYGLPEKPEMRETWHVESGTPVRRNPAMNGTGGATEITIPQALPNKNLVRVEPLH